MKRTFRSSMVAAFAPPLYLAPPFAGIDISTSGVKAVRLLDTPQGLVLEAHADIALPANAFNNGEIVNKAAIVDALKKAAQKANISRAHVSLSESKSYLFETTATGDSKEQWRLAVEQHLEELIPLPPAVTAFDIVPVETNKKQEVSLVGVGFARSLIDDTVAMFDEAGIEARSLESEIFAMVRALLPANDKSTSMVIDVGKTTTRVFVVSNGIPRFATTLKIGGHALTIAVQKYFGVTEMEAKQVKLEQGIVPAQGNEEYLNAMLSTVSVIRDEIATRLAYWQAKVVSDGEQEPVSHAILVGGNATLRGFQEYLQNGLKIPVVTGDVFTNFAPKDVWLPTIEYNESLAYATAIGLALRDYSAP